MAGFYDLTDEQRIERTRQAIRDGSTVTERWTALQPGEAEPWNIRAEAAAQWLQHEPAVADLGCGLMALERHLPPGTAYHPSDVVARDHRTIVCDYNRAPPPITPATAVACLGVLEYLHDPETFMRRLAQTYRTCVVSYCITDAPQALEPREAHAWVNAFDRAGIEALFARAGWTTAKHRPFPPFQALWCLHRVPEPGRTD